MMGVKGSYRKLTGLQPVELKDITTAAELLSVISQ